MTKKTTKKEEKVEEKPVTPPPVEPTAKEEKEVRIIERVIENHEIAPQDAFGKLTRPQIDLMKRTIAKGASDDELKMFIQVCKGANLNPFLKQVHLVPRWDNKEGKEVRAIQVSIDGFRAIAESSGAYAGNEDAVFDGEKTIEYFIGKDAKTKHTLKVPEKATVTVWKMIEGQRFSFTATARWDEYYPGHKMGFQWHQRPYLMLGKCAEALSLRKAFPKLLSGMYAQEEMDRGQTEISELEKTQKALDYVKQSIEKSNVQQLKDLCVLIKKSEKYSESQKDEFLNMISERIDILSEPTLVSE